MSYLEHTFSPYPLDDAEGRVPYDILTDLSLTVGSDVFAEDVYLTSLKVTSSFAFIAFETSTGAVAHAFVEAPVSGRIYRLEAQRGEGWVMFGPGIRKAFELPNGVSVPIDPKGLIVNEPVTAGYTLEVNGRSYPMPPTLTLVCDGFAQNRVEALRDLDSGAAPAINISRDDSVIDETLLTSGLLSGGNPPIRRVGPATPDADGNIDIRVTLEQGLIDAGGTSGVIAVPCTNTDVVGFILWTLGVRGCVPSNLLDQLNFSDCGSGVQFELPFDRLLEKFQDEDTPCGPEAPECESSLGTEE